MKVLIMAGGYATRLWPITKDNPKALLPVGNRVILDYILEKAGELELDTYVSTNRFFEAHFRQYAERYGVGLIVEDTLHEDEKLGTIGALKNALDELGPDDYLVIAGDNLFSFSLRDFLNSYDGGTLIAVYDVGDLELAKRYGVVVLEGDRVISFQEKPAAPRSTLVSTGVYVFPRRVMERIDEYLSNGNRDSPGYFIQWLLERGEEIRAYRFSEYWYDIGSADSYLEALKTLLKESHVEEIQISPYAKIIPPVVIKRGAKILGRSMIGPYAYIGEECVIENSDISDSIIFRGTIIRNSTIWRSIIDEKCEIRNLELRKSLVGGHAKIQRGE
ncbi:sugar phosphate nucleotidyltransferase [Thermococcus thioreducens]|uniref:Glucose-1-phosphate thymidylyltransferase n=1 Tax=Thermococcus thioreducens TaxID=277988 RepID=A0A0Q2XL08_9EURY|nr:NDP-sugar synthase [Thermococcus thioreducens]ASJ11591.1 glucose-1-phosphate thymidylyltransferase [Thermococcus thioreducens]KQH81804.1 glucose-1-phosphate thymidylyltransferase [Thermococcus thioreducens]SEW03859.1 glucose-1-phosphate thymidylyltransferase [Thermococcus thioreducens]